MLFRSKHGNQIDVYFFAFILLSTTVNIGNGNKTAGENKTELYLPYNTTSENSYNEGFHQSSYQPRPKYSRKLKKSKRQLVTIEGSGFDIALQAPDLNQTQVEFEFPDDKRNFTVEIVEISHQSVSNEDNKPPKYHSAPKRRSKISRPLFPLDSQSVTTSKPRPVYNKLKPRLKPVNFNIDIPTAGSNVEVTSDSLRANTVRQPKISSSIRSINEIIEKPKRTRPKPKVIIDTPVLNQVTRGPTRFRSTTSTTEQPQAALDATRRPYYITRSPALIFYDDEKDIHVDDLKSYLAGYSHFGNKESMTAPPSLYGDDEVIDKRYLDAIKDFRETQRETTISQSPSTDVTERQMSISLTGFLPNYPPNSTPPHTKEDEEYSQTMTTASTVEKRKRTLETTREPLESEEEIHDSISKESSGPTRSQNYYTHAQVVPLTKTPESIENEKRVEREKELNENSKNFQGNHQELVVISPNVRYAPKHAPAKKSSEKHGSYADYPGNNRDYAYPTGNNRGYPDSPGNNRGYSGSPKTTGYSDSPEKSRSYADAPKSSRDYADSYSSRGKYDSPSKIYSPPGGKPRDDGTIASRMDHLYRQGHPGVLPPPKDTHDRSYKPSPFRVTADEDFRNPYPHDPLEDEPPLKFDPESDRFYGEPVPDRKQGQSSRVIPVDRESRTQNDPETREEEDRPRERKRDDYDDRRGRDRDHRDNYYNLAVTAYPLTEEERRLEPETDPKGYIQDFVSLDNNFESLPKVRESDFGPLLPKSYDDEFRPHREQDPPRNSQPSRSSSESRPRDYDYDDPSEADYRRDQNRDRDQYSRGREPDPKENDHYAEDESTRDLPQGFSDGYATAGRGFGFDRGQPPSENLPLDPIYTRTLKQFDDEIANLQRNEGPSRDYPPAPTVTRHREDPPPPPPPPVEPYRQSEERSRPPPIEPYGQSEERSRPPPIEPYRQSEERSRPLPVESYRPSNEDRSRPPPRYNQQLPPPEKEESNEDQYPPPKEKDKEESHEEEEEEEEEPEENESEPEARNESEKKQEESRQRDTLQDGKDKRPPPEKPQTEKSGSIDDDIIGIEQEWGRG